MIEKVNLLHFNSVNKRSNSFINPVINNNYIKKNTLLKDTVSFSGQSDTEETDTIEDRFSKIETSMTPQAERLFNEAKIVAERYNNQEITSLHINYVALLKIKEYITKLNAGTINISDNDDDYRQFAEIYKSMTTQDLFKSKKLRNRIIPVINDELLLLEQEFDKLPKNEESQDTEDPENEDNYSEIGLAKSLLNDSYNFFDKDNSGEESDGDGKFDEGYLLDAALNPSDNKINLQIVRPFVYKLQESIMLGDQGSQKGAHLSIYDDKAKNVLKNLGTGTNMFVAYEDGMNPIYMANSIAKMLASEDKFGKLEKNNTDLVYLNNKATFMYLNDLIIRLAQDKSKNHIVVFDLDEMREQEGIRTDALTDKLTEYAPENLRYVVLIKKDSYFKEINDKESDFTEYQGVSIPMLTVEQTKKAFKEEPLLISDIKKNFTPEAIDAIVDATAMLDDKYPEKVVKIMKKMSSYYIDKKNIDAIDVENYVKESKDIFKNEDNNRSIIVKFDTGKRLTDMIGATSTKKEISAIIRQINNKTLGTKGFIIYPQDGQVGGGRKFAAKVIAGETKSPYFEINANDFGTKEVSIFDLLGGGSVSPETAMKKLFDMIKSQAEIAPHKSALLFIEDFEFFTFGENVSEYHKKAMAQLTREMKIARKEGLNIVVMGSVDSGNNISASTQKSFEFVDKIEVESISNNKKAREEIIGDFLNKNNIALEGDSDKASELLSDFADMTEWFSFMELMTLLRKTKSWLKEIGHEKLNKADFVEAYLQTTTGRPASAQDSPHRKKIVTSHECGHALNLSVMYNIAKKQNIPWHLPNKVSFITLDPRGDYGGAVYNFTGENEEYSFEKLFSSIICSYGGHSSERILYHQDGSWGITSDLEHVTQNAYNASSIMAQGHYYGKKSLNAVPFITDKDKEKIEKDVEVFTKNALLISDMIVLNYREFVEEFTKKYAPKVGTGECIVTSEKFESELAEWKSRQPEYKLKQLEKMEKKILKIIEATKQGKIVKNNLSINQQPSFVKKMLQYFGI